MKFSLKWKEGAIRQIGKMPKGVASRIFKKVAELSENPFQKVKKLKGRDSFRLRVGDYRVILDIDQKNKIIEILRVGHRKKIYGK